MEVKLYKNVHKKSCTNLEKKSYKYGLCAQWSSPKDYFKFNDTKRSLTRPAKLAILRQNNNSIHYENSRMLASQLWRAFVCKQIVFLYAFPIISNFPANICLYIMQIIIRITFLSLNICTTAYNNTNISICMCNFILNSIIICNYAEVGSWEGSFDLYLLKSKSQAAAPTS